MTADRKLFEDKVSQVSEKIGLLDGKSRNLSLVRLFVFISFAVSSVLLFKLQDKIIPAVLSALSIIAFTVLVVLHNRIKNDISFQMILKEVYERYIARIDGDFDKLEDKGTEFLDTKDDCSYDLDLFGDRSVYSLYCTAVTFDGKKQFASDLASSWKVSDTEERRDSVKELLGKVGLMASFQAKGIEGKLHIPVNALKAVSSGDEHITKADHLISNAIPGLWILPVASAFFFPRWITSCVLLVLALNITYYFFTLKRYGVYFKAVDGIYRQSRAITALYELLEKEEFETPMLKSIRQGGSSGERPASEGLHRLTSVCEAARLRGQPIMAFILNSVFPYDIFCVDRFFKWRDRYGSELRKSLMSLASFEVLMSCAAVGLTARESCFPVETDGVGFSGKAITHPLLDPKTAVSNDIDLDGKIALITGSNMSGKTTLIRTVGVCCVLGYIGAPVPAASVSFGRMRVMSSMRIVDSIEENMSTFKAELVRIARIIDAASSDGNILFLIDEIFRGTNSTDRTEGAITVLHKLDKPNITGMMTTHDYALCDHVKKSMSDDIVFYNFSEQYDDNGISFDYKLHEGMSDRSNARYLMKLVGITD